MWELRLAIDDVVGGREQPRRWFFVHVLKSGGTALSSRLRALFPDGGFYPDASDGSPEADMPQADVLRLIARWIERAPEIRVLTGHFPLCTTDLLGVPFTTLTVLREPVERTLSYLRHQRVVLPELADRSLEELYDDEARFQHQIHDHMVKMFSLRAEEMTDGVNTVVGPDPTRLDRAKLGLLRVDALGLQERFGEFWHDTSQRFGWQLGPVVTLNRTPPDPRVTPALRRRIEADNAGDVALYDFAVDVYERRRR
jgi:hypothetical protein